MYIKNPALHELNLLITVGSLKKGEVCLKKVPRKAGEFPS
jgi:hypothetical protein